MRGVASPGEELSFARDNADVICASCLGTAATTAVRTSAALTPGTLVAATAIARAAPASLLAAPAAAAGATTGTLKAIHATAAGAAPGLRDGTACPTADATA